MHLLFEVNVRRFDVFDRSGSTSRKLRLEWSLLHLHCVVIQSESNWLCHATFKVCAKFGSLPSSRVTWGETANCSSICEGFFQFLPEIHPSAFYIIDNCTNAWIIANIMTNLAPIYAEVQGWRKPKTFRETRILKKKAKLLEERTNENNFKIVSMSLGFAQLKEHKIIGTASFGQKWRS